MEGQPKKLEEVRQEHADGTVDEIVETIHEVRRALASLISSFGDDQASVRETARQLDIDRNLVWLIFKIIKNDDILKAALEIPTSRRIDGFCRACLDQGAPSKAIGDVRLAMQRFENMVEIYAGSRDSFTDLIHSMVYDDVTARQEEARKAVFRGNSSIWGVQARVNFKTGICFPSKTQPGMVDAIRIGGLVGFKRLRPVRWPVFQMITHKDDGSEFQADTRPLDPVLEGAGGLPLVRDFCSDPMLNIQSFSTAFGEFFDLMPGPIGKVGIVDCVLGDIIRGIDHEYDQGGDKYLATRLELQTPAEFVILDTFLHQSLSHSTPPEIIMADRLSRNQGYGLADEESSRLPLSSQVMALPPGTAGSANSNFPDYPKLLEFAFSKAGLDVREFRGFRFVMKYPVVPSVLRMLLLKSPIPD